MDIELIVVGTRIIQKDSFEGEEEPLVHFCRSKQEAIEAIETICVENDMIFNRDDLNLLEEEEKQEYLSELDEIINVFSYKDKLDLEEILKEKIS